MQKTLSDALDEHTDLYSYIASIMYDVSYEECCEFNPDGTVNETGKVLRDSVKQFLLPIIKECNGVCIDPELSEY